jgi:hypothetical protein
LDQESHCRVPNNHKTDDDYRLGQWVAVQRQHEETMDPVRRRRLQELPGWSWDPIWDQWEEGFSRLKQFLEKERHCRVPKSYKTGDGYRLGQWGAVQRRTKDVMEPDRRQRLEALPGWSWNVLSDEWEKGFHCLKQFSDREGHCRVPAQHKTDDNYRLGQWVGVQRTNKEKMDSDRRQRLEAVPGWVWKAKK